MVSVVCCYNNKEQYYDMTQSLASQDMEYELIGIDNRNNRFTSAAAALNCGGIQATGEVVVFLHQDIIFERQDSLRLFVNALPRNEKAIIGLYGASHVNMGFTRDGLQRVETLDECCVAMTKETWKAIQFNEKICDGWHLYVVEMCLRASEQNVLVASGNFPIKHLSSGSVDERYMKTFKKLLVQFKEHGWISTTCKSMPTQLPYYYGYYAVWKAKKVLLGNFPLAYKLKSVLKR